MAKQNRNIIFTTIAIEAETDKLIEKLCKRYSLKKGEITKLAFLYLDKAHINPADAPESVKTELAKINKRQDDIMAQLQISVAYFCSIGLYFLV